MLFRCVDRCSFQCQRGRNWGGWVGGWDGGASLLQRERERERERERDITCIYIYIHMYICIMCMYTHICIRSSCLCVNMWSIYLGPYGLICRVEVLKGHRLCKKVLGPSGAVRWTPELSDLP